MTKTEKLEYARLNYPVGTKFISLINNTQFEVEAPGYTFMDDTLMGEVIETLYVKVKPVEGHSNKNAIKNALICDKYGNWPMIITKQSFNVGDVVECIDITTDFDSDGNMLAKRRNGLTLGNHYIVMVITNFGIVLKGYNFLVAPQAFKLVKNNPCNSYNRVPNTLSIDSVQSPIPNEIYIPVVTKRKTSIYLDVTSKAKDIRFKPLVGKTKQIKRVVVQPLDIYL